jgi:high-affinity iron transporter
MLASLLITLREGLEAALVVGVVLSVLRRLGQGRHSRVVWAGVLAAVVVSIGAALGLNRLGLAFEGRGEQIFEGLAMLLAAGVLTWMILWMRREGAQVSARLSRDADRAVSAGSRSGLFWLAFVAVVREGIETVLFLTAAALTAQPGQTLLGGALGLALAIGLGWLIFAGGKRLDVGAFFRWTSWLLIAVAAGLVAHGVHELQEAGWLPTVVEHLYDVNGLVDEKGVVGGLLQALFGYNGNPALLEVLSYLGYWAAVLLGYRGQSPPRAASQPTN